MPLRDHLIRPFNFLPFEGVHGAWPTVMVYQLFGKLPPGYSAAPQVGLGTSLEFDLAAYADESAERPRATELPEWSAQDSDGAGSGGTATLARPEPSLTLACVMPEPAEYEVRICNAALGRKLVAVVEIVSPSNKDRPGSRRAFVAKCAALLQSGVSVAIVDICGTPDFNIYSELLAWVGRSDPTMADNPPLYAVACRACKARRKTRLENWAHVLAVGKPLPAIPIWLSDDLWVTLDLEASNEETCRLLNVPPFSTSPS